MVQRDENVETIKLVLQTCRHTLENMILTDKDNINMTFTKHFI